MPQMPCVVSSWPNSDSSSRVVDSSMGPHFQLHPLPRQNNPLLRSHRSTGWEQEPENECSGLLSSSKHLWVTFIRSLLVVT